LEVAQAFGEGGALGVRTLARGLDAPQERVATMLEALERAGIVALRGPSGEAALWQLARPAGSIRVGDVLGALRGDATRWYPARISGRVAREVLEALGRAEADGAGGLTLATLLADVTSVDPGKERK
jgi:DNA-binding IscR family transcriptional regulator